MRLNEATIHSSIRGISSYGHSKQSKNDIYKEEVGRKKKRWIYALS